MRDKAEAAVRQGAMGGTRMTPSTRYTQCVRWAGTFGGMWWSLLLLLVCVLGLSHASAPEYEEYDTSDYVAAAAVQQESLQQGSRGAQQRLPRPRITLPMCCRKHEIFDYSNCKPPASGHISWRPVLEGAPGATFAYSGFPKCSGGKLPADLYQKDVFFHNDSLYLPHYVQLHPAAPSQYCVVKVIDEQQGAVCEQFQTKVYVCLEKQADDPATVWTVVTLSHILVALTLLAYLCITELRSLQGQYLICFFISLLFYNLCLFPLSHLSFDMNQVTCIALRAIKYFFFCGVFLWFNIISFDVWRTMRNGQDISGRRRFLLYSLFVWLVSAMVTTAVLVLTILNEDSSSLSASNYTCSLGLSIHMVLQLVQAGTMLVNLVLLSLALSHMCTYSKLGNGLPRCDATLCLKQSWKLYAIMLAHTLMSVSQDVLKLDILTLWQYLFIESLAIFAIFCYRKASIKALHRCCRGCCCVRENSIIGTDKAQMHVLG